MARMLKQTLKRISAAFLAFAVAVSAFMAFAADAPSVKMNKTEYSVGDTAEVSYENMPGSDDESASDYRWYGIYHADEIPGLPGYGVVNEFWDYFKGDKGSITLPEEKFSALQPGEYKICFFAGETKTDAGNYIIEDDCYFTIVSDSEPGEPTVTINKEVFTNGERPLIEWNSITGDKTWYGVLRAGQVPGEVDSIFWAYVGESGSTDFSDAQDGSWEELPNGDYTVFFMADEEKINGRYTVLAQADFTVNRDSDPENMPSVKMDKTVYVPGEAVKVEWNNIPGNQRWYGIYSYNDIPGAPGVGSKFWNYVSSSSGTLDFSDVQGGSWDGLSNGKYKICFFADENKVGDVYVIQAQFDFEIQTLPPESAPKAVVYERDQGAKQGFAKGTVTLTPPDDRTNMTGYALCWGDDKGPFEDYAPIKVHGITDSGKDTKTYKFNDSLYIPAKATKLYAYSASGTDIPHNPNDMKKSEGFASADVPQGAAFNEEKPLYSFQVTSDWHIFGTDKNSIKAKRLDKMLKDVKATDPDSIAIIGNGDVTDNSPDDPYPGDISPEQSLAEFKVLNEVIDDNKEGLPQILFAVGNHDMRGGDGYRAQMDRFLEGTKTTGTDGKPYYYREIGGAKFIFLGTEASCDTTNNAYLSTTQLKWLEQTLEENSKTSEPIFVFLHQPLDNTTSGTTGRFNWNGVSQDRQVRSILKKYPQVVWFSGHTHWELESADPVYSGFGKDFTAFNDAGIGKLYDDNDRDKDGSQGLYVEVYKDKILVKGRDFENGLWVTYSQFIVDTTLPMREKINNITQPDELLANRQAAADAYEELNAMGEDKGWFEELYQEISKVNKELESLRDDVWTAYEKLQELKESVKNKVADSAALNECKTLYNSLTEDEKSYLPDAENVFAQAQKIIDDQKPEPQPEPQPDPNPQPKPQPQPAPAVPKNGVKNGILYKNSKKVTGTKVIRAGSKTYYVKRGKVQKGRKIVKYKNKLYAVNNGIVMTAKKTRVVKAGKKSYIVSRKGIVSHPKKGYKQYKVGRKKYIVNKSGVIQKNKKRIRIGKITYRTNKKGIVVKTTKR